jgi:hypothetical protein
MTLLMIDEKKYDALLAENKKLKERDVEHLKFVHQLHDDIHNLKQKLEKIEEWGYIALDYLDKMELEHLTKEFKEILGRKA